MITKAGVPTHKLLQGLASYGRSFKMSEAGCTGPMCRFEGNSDSGNSPAKPGRCTDTGGYLALAEIDEIIADRGEDNVKQWSSEGSRFLVYDGKK